MNIYALSSGRGPSGIAIVRISGKDSLKICKNLTKLNDINSNEVNYCKFYDHKNDSKFLVTGNIKISYFIKNKEFDKNNLLNTLGLEKNKINVTFAPSWNAHGKDFLEKFRFLPKSFENRTKAIKVLADQLKNENCNFIIYVYLDFLFNRIYEFYWQSNKFANCRILIR